MSHSSGTPPPYRDVTVGDLLTRLARALPDREALVYGDGPRLTFGALEQEARTIARGLMALGVARGERVVLWATNVPEWVVLQFAIAKAGAILVTANTSLRGRDVDYLLRQSEAATLITIRGFRDVDYVDELAAIGATAGRIPGLERLIFIARARCRWRRAREGGRRRDADGFTPYDDLRAAASRVSEAELDARSAAIGPDDVINMQYTSGTTGFPKGVMLSSRNIVNNGEALGRVLGYTPDDRLCLCVPLFHCFGCVIGVLGAFTHGACLCPVVAFDPKQVLETVHRERCTALYGVPTMFIAELECPDFARYDLSSLRTGVMAGALCPEPLMRRVMTEMHLPEITIAYGMTESSPGITMTPRDSSIAQRSQTVGPVLPELEVKIVDPATGVTVRARRARRAVLPRLQRDEGLLQQPRRRRARRSTPTAGCTPATRPAWTRTAASGSPGASRTSSSAAARTSRRRRSRIVCASTRRSPTPTSTASPIRFSGKPSPRRSG